MPKEPKDYQATFRVVGEVYDNLLRISDRMDVPYSHLIRYSLKKYVLNNTAPIERLALLNTRKHKDPADGQLVFRMATTDREKLKAKAHKLDVTPIDLIRYSVLQYLDEVKRAA